MERGQIKGGKWTETPSFKELISIATNGKIWSYAKSEIQPYLAFTQPKNKST